MWSKNFLFQLIKINWNNLILWKLPEANYDLQIFFLSNLIWRIRQYKIGIASIPSKNNHCLCRLITYIFFSNIKKIHILYYACFLKNLLLEQFITMFFVFNFTRSIMNNPQAIFIGRGSRAYITMLQNTVFTGLIWLMRWEISASVIHYS